MTGVVTTFLLSPIIYNHLSQDKVHHDLNYDCAIFGLPQLGFMLSFIPGLLWCAFAFGCMGFSEDNGVNGDQHVQGHDNVSASLPSSVMDFNSASAPPQVADEILSVAIDLGHVVDISSPAIGKLQEEGGGEGENAVVGVESGCSSCAICSVAPAEGACVPCGHVAGCMSCLKKLTNKRWGCPVCRANIDWVMKLYYV
ncbi:putative E3 ubiquitin-protein ligase XBAT35 [Lotus japonicus]|uniref:putative E3 ubiquitin-protein ligase XBAT35 n=1 Tax=Lotus japonicus TaxID=34305 RepID=UPI002585CE25|nr:putative E3 ubiquitin-protein ligase XBAT35 [Lotus japonicus]